MTLSFLTKYKIYLRYNIAYSILSAFFYKKNLFINKINNGILNKKEARFRSELPSLYINKYEGEFP